LSLSQTGHFSPFVFNPHFLHVKDTYSPGEDLNILKNRIIATKIPTAMAMKIITMIKIRVNDIISLVQII